MATFEDFVNSPLITWVGSCLHSKIERYDDLIDGSLLHAVLLTIDPQVPHIITPSREADRIRNMICVVKHLKGIYEEEYGELVAELPNCVHLAKNSESTGTDARDMRLLLLLLLGCAVQCPNKHIFIERIKSLPVECQENLVLYIQQVTESQQIVICPDNPDNPLSVDLLLNHVRKLIKERDYYSQMWYSALEEQNLCSSSAGNISVDSPNQLVVQLADLKAKFRKLRQELEEKSEAYIEAKEEWNRCTTIIVKMKSEISDLKKEARDGNLYRDELDAMREKVHDYERLEKEVDKYRGKLIDLEYYQSRVEELTSDVRNLEGTKEMLEEELACAKRKGERLGQLEQEFSNKNQTVEELLAKNNLLQEKIQELTDENNELGMMRKRPSISNDDGGEPSENISANVLSEQLHDNAMTRALKLELENRKLAAALEKQQESTFHRENERIAELNREKMELTMRIEELENIRRKLTQQSSDLENLRKEEQNQLKRAQESGESLRNELQAKRDEGESLRREMARLEGELGQMKRSLEASEERAKGAEGRECLEEKICAWEKEMNKLKHAKNENAALVDKLTVENEALQKERERSAKQMEEIRQQVSRLQDVESAVKDLEKQRKIDVATLTALENDLVAEKLKTKHLKNSLDAFGLTIDNAEGPDKILEKIASNTEVLKAVRVRLAREKSSCCSSSDEEEESESSYNMNNAKLQVTITTMESRISSLSSQNTALQLANSQLVVEREEATKESTELRNTQAALQNLHEQASADYEALQKDWEAAKAQLRDVKASLREFKERNASLSELYKVEKENYRTTSDTLNELREEHSKFKYDFKTLLKANERLKSDYRELEKEYRKASEESEQLKAAANKLRGELSNNEVRITSLKGQIAKLNEKCERLCELNGILEEDKRDMMEQARLLLNQYRELFGRSLEDKKLYYEEEKKHLTKANDWHRQKEKLEEKIMEHYRNLESRSNKKLGFGANIVRKVKKAGTDFINKNRRNPHREKRSEEHNVSESSTEFDAQESDLDDYLSQPGTRRPFYVSSCNDAQGDDAATISSKVSDESSTKSGAPPPPTAAALESNGEEVQQNAKSAEGQTDQRSFLVFNKVTTTVGANCAGQTQACPASPSRNGRRPGSVASDGHRSAPSGGGGGGGNTAENSIWYEYGCV